MEKPNPLVYKKKTEIPYQWFITAMGNHALMTTSASENISLALRKFGIRGDAIYVVKEVCPNALKIRPGDLLVTNGQNSVFLVWVRHQGGRKNHGGAMMTSLTVTPEMRLAMEKSAKELRIRVSDWRRIAYKNLLEKLKKTI